MVMMLSGALLLVTSWGLAWHLAAYVTVGAFGAIVRAPDDPTMHRQLDLWMIYFVVSLGITVWLFVVYRKGKRNLWKSD
jgi:hypothetical protein